ncbi:uncharacterized protein LOC144493461 [Mustelus asterias]
MTKMWMLCFGVVALAALIQIQVAGNSTSTAQSATTSSGGSVGTRSSSSSDSSMSGNSSSTSEPPTLGAGVNSSQSTTVNSTSVSLHSPGGIFLLPFTITTSILYLSC